MTQKPKDIFRIVLMLLSIGVTLGCVIATVVIIKRIDLNTGIPPLLFNEVTDKSIDIQLELARNFFQIALVMTGALLGLIIAKKDEIRLVFSRYTEVIMFVGACALLLLSMGAYCLYLSQISNYFADAVVQYRSAIAQGYNLKLSVPNILDQNVNYLFTCQIVSLFAGILNGVFTFLSAHRLRD